MISDYFSEQSSTLSEASNSLPKDKQQEVAAIYTFLKSLDASVSNHKRKEFFAFAQHWQDSWNGEVVDDAVTETFMELSYKYQFERKWIESYFASKKFDLEKKQCTTIADTIWYMYGSAEVIGLMFCRIANLPEEAEKYAALMGRAVQFVNFLRNWKLHVKQGKHYIPALPADPKTNKERERFTEETRKQLKKFYSWLHEAKKGFPLIPYKLRVSVMTMADSYSWIAKQIERDPLRVFQERIRVPRHLMRFYTVKNKVQALFIKE